MHHPSRRLPLSLAIAVVLAVAVAAFEAPSTPWVTTGFPVAQASFAKLQAPGS